MNKIIKTISTRLHHIFEETKKSDIKRICFLSALRCKQSQFTTIIDSIYTLVQPDLISWQRRTDKYDITQLHKSVIVLMK